MALSISVSSSKLLSSTKQWLCRPCLSMKDGVTKIVKGMLKDCGSIQPLPSNGLRVLEKKLTHQKALTRILKKSFQLGYAQKQEVRQRSAEFVLKAMPQVAGLGMSPKEFAEVVKSSTDGDLSQVEAKYIEKFCAKAMAQPLFAELAQLRADVHTVIEGFVAEYRPDQQIGHYSTDRLFKSERMVQELLKVLNGKSFFQLLDTPKNRQLAQKLNSGLLGRVEQFKQKHGDVVLQEFVHQELPIFSVLGYMQFPMALKHVVLKGANWANSEFPSQREALMQSIDQAISSIQTELNQDPRLLNTLSDTQGVWQHVTGKLDLLHQEPWNKMSDYVEHLLQQKYENYASSGFLGKLQEMSQNLSHQVSVWHTELFSLSNPPKQFSSIPGEKKEEQAVALYQQFVDSSKNNGIGEELFKHLIREAMRKPIPYQLNFEPRNEGPSIAPLVSGYFKAHKNSALSSLSATRVKTVSGKVYELLNHLTPEASQALFDQHRLNKNGKVVLGEGGFGKVRLARDMDTQHIVAVKKFVEDAKFSANEELDKVKLVQDRAVSEGRAVSTTLASVLDHAHVKVPSRVLDNQFVDKSYVFMPLINGGDGNEAAKSLREMRRSDHDNRTNHATTRFLNIAKGYAESVKNLHALGFHHRDIKPGNFMHSWVEGTEPGKPIEQLKLIDFGFLETNKTQKKYGVSSFMYLPPEVQSEQGRKNNYDAELHDSYSLGMSLFELRMGSNLYSGIPLNLTLKRTDGQLLSVPLEVHHHSFSRSYPNELCCKGVPSEFLNNLAPNHIDNILAKLLAADPKERMTATQAFDDLQKLSVPPVPVRKNVRRADDV
jgi:serine/threonine protein kinase